MGLSLSLLISAWKQILDQGLFIICNNSSFSPKEKALILKSNSFKITEPEAAKNRALILKSSSFKISEPEAVKNRAPTGRTKPNSLKGNKPEILETSFSFKTVINQDAAFSFPVSAGKYAKSAASLPEPAVLYSPRPVSELDAAAVKLQKVYKSYRTRRNLADCAVVVEELWWKAIDFANLKRSSVSFFNIEKPETAVSRWARARTRAAKVGKGLSKDDKAQKLALQHWLEAVQISRSKMVKRLSGPKVGSGQDLEKSRDLREHVKDPNKNF